MYLSGLKASTYEVTRGDTVEVMWERIGLEDNQLKNYSDVLLLYKKDYHHGTVLAGHIDTMAIAPHFKILESTTMKQNPLKRWDLDIPDKKQDTLGYITVDTADFEEGETYLVLWTIGPLLRAVLPITVMNAALRKGTVIEDKPL